MRVLGIREKVRKERVNVSRRIVTCWRITVKTRPSTLCSSRYDHARRRRSKLLQDRYASTDGPWRQSIKPTLTPAAVSCSEEATNLLCWCLGAYVEGEFVRRMGAHMHMAQSSHPSLRAYLTPAVADEARAPPPPPPPPPPPAIAPRGKLRPDVSASAHCQAGKPRWKYPSTSFPRPPAASYPASIHSHRPCSA